MIYDYLIIGGGAAGYFSALHFAELKPGSKVLILEKGKQVLSKVRISGGGRCNVTHACFEPKALTKFYPRGERELLGPFHRFMTGDMMAWLDERGVATKIEEDNRVFPVSDQSQSIIDCFENERLRLNIELEHDGMEELIEEADYIEVRGQKSTYRTKALLVATGSSPKTWKSLSDFGVKCIPPVPSLFTLNIKHPLLSDLPGTVFPEASVKVAGSKLKEFGPVLITHWGLSGPAVLRLSAWGAIDLAAKQHRFNIHVNWTSTPEEDVFEELKNARNSSEFQGKKIQSRPLFQLTKKFWNKLLEVNELHDIEWGNASNKQLKRLSLALADQVFEVTGKSTFKDEFVTAGGVDLKEINFKTMQHKQHPRVFFAGEVLNIDAITGGFNFQAAWTTAWIAAEGAVLVAE
ncbi:MAG: aminoacetone oxidase family FAD-binding enzyme [Flavobacteriales bacterium]|nr:aminoacetone oxidase family FAD-binding enzyme [Flavobacteriales bacterium]